MIDWGVGEMAKTLGIPKENVRLISPFIGGGFGGKLFVRADALLAALGARAARTAGEGRAAARLDVQQHARIARRRSSASASARPGTERSRPSAMKAGPAICPAASPRPRSNRPACSMPAPNRLTATRLAVLDLPEGNAMRAPGEAPGMMALEIAIDEMAEKLGLDPIEFRIINDTQVVPDNPSRPPSQDPQSARAQAGAEDPQPPVLAAATRRVLPHGRRALRLEPSATRQPGQLREGRWLIGMGVAAAFRNNQVTKSAARVRLDNRGVVTVETDMTDIGTGSYTIIAQTAAEMMGVPLEKVVVRLGDSSFPGFRRLRRPVGRQLLDGRRLCRLRQAARGRGAEARASTPPTPSLPMARCARATAAFRSPRRRSRDRPCRGGSDRIRRPRQEVPAIDLRRAFRRSRRRCRDG